MKIDHVCFYVENAGAMREWFADCLGFQSIASGIWNHHHTEVVQSGQVIFVLRSPADRTSPAAKFLAQHPCGVCDVALQVDDLDKVFERAISQGATPIHPIKTVKQSDGLLKWAAIASWGSVIHTLVERTGITPLLPPTLISNQASHLPIQANDCIPASLPPQPSPAIASYPLNANFLGIDHVVLNVPNGELASAVAWYQTVLGLEPEQVFKISTDRSALCSQVMRHPTGSLQIPINEPASPNSQIQEFLDANRGAGIQHIALETPNLVHAIAQFRDAGVKLIQVPPTYYQELKQRPNQPFSEATLQAIATQQLLADWQDDTNAGILLQTFTQPIFKQPTFFLEFIERQSHPSATLPCKARGFGEGNFRALFEAIEQEQIRRGAMTCPNVKSY